MADKSTIGDLKAVLENSFAEMQSDEQYQGNQKRCCYSTNKTWKNRVWCCLFIRKISEDFIVKPIAATKQTIETPLDLKEEKVANGRNPLRKNLSLSKVRKLLFPLHLKPLVMILTFNGN